MLNLEKLKELEAELEKRTGRNKNWIYANKIDGELDFRVLDPLPNMDGVFFLQVIVWWVNGKRIISPATFGDPCTVEQFINDIKAFIIANSKKTDSNGKMAKEMNILLNATSGVIGKKVQQKYEYWLAGLQFAWKVDKDNHIEGIYDEKKRIDPLLIDNFVVDGTPKVLQCGPMLIKCVSKCATVRGGLDMCDKDKGFNLIISKTGEGRETVYTAQRGEIMPMPDKYYGEGNQPDLIKLAKAGIRTREYIEGILNNYFYGDKLPDDGEDTYQYPEARKDNAFVGEEEVEEEMPKSARPTSHAPADTTNTSRSVKSELPWEREGIAYTKVENVPAQRVSRSVPAVSSEDKPRATRGRPAKGRNVMDDLQDA